MKVKLAHVKTVEKKEQNGSEQNSKGWRGVIYMGKGGKKYNICVIGIFKDEGTNFDLD